MNTTANLKHSLSAIAIAAALALPLAAAPSASWADEGTNATQVAKNAATTASVKARLMADDRTQAFDINVDTTGDGHVILRGTAPSEEAKQVAGELAAQADGTTRVENALVVAPPGSVAERSAPPATASQHARQGLERAGDATGEAWLSTKVKAALLADGDVKGLDISVSTDADIVTLEGEVPNEAMKARAIELAADVEGVARVDSRNLIVSR